MSALDHGSRYHPHGVAWRRLPFLLIVPFLVAVLLGWLMQFIHSRGAYPVVAESSLSPLV